MSSRKSKYHIMLYQGNYHTADEGRDYVIKWKHYPCYWPFVRGIHRSPVNSPHKGQWHGALMFSLICALNKRLSKQSWCRWFGTPSSSLWRHCNERLTQGTRSLLITVEWAPGRAQPASRYLHRALSLGEAEPTDYKEINGFWPANLSRTLFRICHVIYVLRKMIHLPLLL